MPRVWSPLVVLVVDGAARPAQVPRLHAPRVPRPQRRDRMGEAMSAAIDPDKLARLVADGYSDAELADVFGCSARTVLRRRGALGIDSQWRPAPARCGTASGYKAGCRCGDCRSANAAAHADYVARCQAATVRARRWGEPWTVAEDQTLARLGVVQASQVLERTYHACQLRRRVLKATL